jgi:hypothetical protein
VHVWCVRFWVYGQHHGVVGKKASHLVAAVTLCMCVHRTSGSRQQAATTHTRECAAPHPQPPSNSSCKHTTRAASKPPQASILTRTAALVAVVQYNACARGDSCSYSHNVRPCPLEMQQQPQQPPHPQQQQQQQPLLHHRAASKAAATAAASVTCVACGAAARLRHCT